MQDGRNAAGGHPRTGQETLPPYRRSSPTAAARQAYYLAGLAIRQ